MSLAKKDQLTVIYLQFQRTLVLMAIKFYEKNTPLRAIRLSPEILDLTDEKQISEHLEHAKALKEKWLVRVASTIHQSLDRSRLIKAIFVSVLLYLKLFLKPFLPRKANSQYAEWIKKENHVANVSQNIEILQVDQVLSRDHFKDDLVKILNQPGETVAFQNEPGQVAKSLASTITACKSFTLAYGDGDLLLKNGSRINPRFHPKWNLRYFVGQNCLRGLVIFSKHKLREFIKDRSPQTWNELIAELAIDLPEREICHVSKVLFHSQLPRENEQKQLRENLDKKLREKYRAHLEISNDDVANIIWPLPDVPPKVSILIPTRDRVDLVKTLVDGLLNETDYPNLEIIIIDNQSSREETLKYFSSLKNNSKVQIHKYDFKFNYSAINNFGFQFCSGEVLALLNNDIEIMNSTWLKEMVREALAPDVGIVGAKLYFKNRFIQHAGVILGSGLSPLHVNGMDFHTENGYLNRLRFPHQLSAVTGACMVMKREVFAEVGGFDAENLSVAYNDIDLCLRVSKLGRKIVWTPRAELFHLESASRPPDRRPEQIERYRKEVEYMRTTWSDLTKADPYYNSNFSRENGRFELKPEK